MGAGRFDRPGYVAKAQALRGFVRPLIGEPLTDDALEGIFRPLGILNAEGGAVVLAEIELGKVAMKVLLAAVLTDALHCPA